MRIVLVDVVDEYLAHLKWWPSMPQWGMGGEKWQRFTRGPIVISRWIQANLYLNCIYIRFSSHLRVCFSTVIT